MGRSRRKRATNGYPFLTTSTAILPRPSSTSTKRDVSAPDLASQEELRHLGLDVARDGAARIGRAPRLGVVSALVEPRVHGGIGHVELHPARGLELPPERGQHAARDLGHVVPGERREGEHLVQAVVELGRERRTRRPDELRPRAPSPPASGAAWRPPKPMRAPRSRARMASAPRFDVRRITVFVKSTVCALSRP